MQESAVVHYAPDSVRLALAVACLADCSSDVQESGAIHSAPGTVRLALAVACLADCS